MARCLFTLIGLVFIFPIYAQKVGPVVQIGHIDRLQEIAFSPDGKLAVSGGERKSIKIWDVASGKVIRHINPIVYLKDSDEEFFEPLYSFAISKDDRYLAVWFGQEEQAIVWRIADGAKMADLNLPAEAEHLLAFVSDTVVADFPISAEPPAGRAVTLWNILSGHPVGRLSVQAAEKVFAHGSVLRVDQLENGPIHVTDALSGRRLFSYSGKNLRGDTGYYMMHLAEASVASSDGHRVAMFFEEGSVGVFASPAGSETANLSVPGAKVAYCAFSSEGKRLVCTFDDESVRLWNFTANDTGEVTILKNATRPSPKFDEEFVDRTPTSEVVLPIVRVSPDGRMAAISSPSQMVRFIDLDHPEIRPEPTSVAHAISAFQLNEDQKTMLFGFGNEVSRWTLDGERNAALPSVSFEMGDAYEPLVTYSPEGKYVFVRSGSGQNDRNGELWNVATGIRTGISLPDSEALFAPGGERMVSFPAKDENNERQATMWDLRTEKKIWTAKIAGWPFVFAKDGRLVIGENEIDTMTGRVKGKAAIPTDQIYMTFPSFFREGLKEGGLGDFGVGVCASKLENPVTKKAFERAICDVYFTAGNKMIIGRTEQGEIKILTAAGDEIATLIPLGNTDWIVITPDGRFDTSIDLGELNSLIWIASDDPLRPLPIEMFWRQYYEARLLQRILKCREETLQHGGDRCKAEFKPLPPFGRLNRVQPKITGVDF